VAAGVAAGGAREGSAVREVARAGRRGRRQGAGLPGGKEAFEAGENAVELLEQQGEQGVAHPELRARVVTRLGGQDGAQRGEGGGGGVHLSALYITDI